MGKGSIRGLFWGWGGSEVGGWGMKKEMMMVDIALDQLKRTASWL